MITSFLWGVSYCSYFSAIYRNTRAVDISRGFFTPSPAIGILTNCGVNIDVRRNRRISCPEAPPRNSGESKSQPEPTRGLIVIIAASIILAGSIIILHPVKRQTNFAI